MQVARCLVPAALSAALVLCGLPTLASAEQPEPVRVALYEDAGTGPTRENVAKALAAREGIRVERIKADDIRAGRLEEFDVLIHPGGSGSKQAASLGDDGRERVRAFVEQGGGYVGICAGAYLATCDYDWSLHILDARVIDRKHWARGWGNVDLAITSTGREVLGLDDETRSIYYHQGPLLAPGNDPAVPDYEPLAHFAGEIAKKGAPPGVMLGTTAIAAGRFGAGKVICYSPHAEKTPGLESIVTEGVLWSATRP